MSAIQPLLKRRGLVRELHKPHDVVDDQLADEERRHRQQGAQGAQHHRQGGELRAGSPYHGEEGRRLRNAPTRCLKDVGVAAEGPGMPPPYPRLWPQDCGLGAVKISPRAAAGRRATAAPHAAPENGERPACRRGGGKDLRLVEAFVGGSDDRHRTDLAVLGIEDHPFAQCAEVLFAECCRRMGDLENLAVGHRAVSGHPGEILLDVGHRHPVLGDGHDQLVGM